jgi:hypothetical protein
VFLFPATSVQNFQQHIIVHWNALVPGVAKSNIDAALSDLNLGFGFDQFVTGETSTYFSKIVYAIRNAIVHNKETEFHLTYASLDPTMRLLIESFLIPILEKICFSLIGSPNVDLWYQNKSLSLYK